MTRVPVPHGRVRRVTDSACLARRRLTAPCQRGARRVAPCAAWPADGELNRGPDHDPRLRGSNVRLSGSEQRRWRELEAQLLRDRRLAALSRRLAARSAGGEVPQRACHVCVLTVCAGLGAAAAAVLLHSGALAVVSVAV